MLQHLAKSKPWNWGIAAAPQWEVPAAEIYPLVCRWKGNHFLKCLDLGCGIGRHAFFLAENGFQVDAFDLSSEGIEKIAKIAKERNLPIKTAIGDMLSLPYESDLFDCLIAFHAIYHTDDTGIKKVISEIKRVLKPGGEAYITFNSQNSSAFKNSENKHLTRNTIFKTAGHEANIPHYYATKEGIENLLRDFQIIEFSYKEEYWQTEKYTGAHYHVLVKKHE